MDATLRDLDRRARTGDREALATLIAWHLRLGLLHVTEPSWVEAWGWERLPAPRKRSRQREARLLARLQRQGEAQDRAEALRGRAPVSYVRRGVKPSKRRLRGV